MDIIDAVSELCGGDEELIDVYVTSSVLSNVSPEIRSFLEGYDVPSLLRESEARVERWCQRNRSWLARKGVEGETYRRGARVFVKLPCGYEHSFPNVDVLKDWPRPWAGRPEGRYYRHVEVHVNGEECDQDKWFDEKSPETT